MRVILLERLPKYGQMGDVVNVKPGFARNFLLPQGKALAATKANIKSFETRKAQIEVRNLESRKEAEDLAGRMTDQVFPVIRSASETGSLYGSVNSRDIARAATAGGFSVDRKQVTLARPIKELGLHSVTVVLHPEVSLDVMVDVARTEEEAELRASERVSRDATAESGAAREADGLPEENNAASPDEVTSGQSPVDGDTGSDGNSEDDGDAASVDGDRS